MDHIHYSILEEGCAWCGKCNGEEEEVQDRSKQIYTNFYASAEPFFFITVSISVFSNMQLTHLTKYKILLISSVAFYVF
jgi:hypothetical protein